MPNPIFTANSTTGNGTATPATATVSGISTGNLLLCMIGCTGSTATSIAIPTGDSWQQIKNVAGSGSGVPSFAMFQLPNAASGSHTPSSVLTGTLTGWIIAIFEVTAEGANEALILSASQTSSAAQLTNVIATTKGQADPNALFVYTVLRIGATTISSPTSGLNNWAPPGYQNSATNWSASQQPLANIQGLSLDTYYGLTNGAWPCPWPQGAGLLSAAVNSVQIYGFFNSQATIPSPGGLVTNIGGGANATVVPNFMQGMVGG